MIGAGILLISAMGYLPDTGQVAPPPAPIVRVWTMPRCRGCDQVKADLKEMTAHDIRYRDYRTADREIAPLLQTHGLPLVEWNTADGRRFYMTHDRWRGYDYFRRVHARSLKP